MAGFDALGFDAGGFDVSDAVPAVVAPNRLRLLNLSTAVFVAPPPKVNVVASETSVKISEVPHG